MATKIIKCTCESKYQDEKYEASKRVANGPIKNSDGKAYRCTVCGRVDR